MEQYSAVSLLFLRMFDVLRLYQFYVSSTSLTPCNATSQSVDMQRMQPLMESKDITIIFHRQRCEGVIQIKSKAKRPEFPENRLNIEREHSVGTIIHHDRAITVTNLIIK